MSEAVVLPGSRDIRARLDRAIEESGQPRDDGADPSAGASVGAGGETDTNTDRQIRSGVTTPTETESEADANAAVNPGRQDSRDESTSGVSTSACVVACPPHPQHGGHRGDRRLTAVSEALVERGISCLRFGYGPWDGGHGETADAGVALEWARDHFDSIGLFGYSFGGCIALVTASSQSALDATAALAPAVQIDSELDAVSTLEKIDGPLQVVSGNQDTTVEWEPIVERTREIGGTVVEVPARHSFRGHETQVANAVGDFFGRTLDDSRHG